VQIDLTRLAASILRGDGRPASETDAAALLRELGWTYDGKGWRGERRAVEWLRRVGALPPEPSPSAHAKERGPRDG
jgi:hypothetical protein